LSFRKHETSTFETRIKTLAEEQDEELHSELSCSLVDLQAKISSKFFRLAVSVLNLSLSDFLVHYQHVMKDDELRQIFVMNLFETLTFTFQKDDAELNPLSKDSLTQIYKYLR
jgi:hypothetical protein